MKIEKGKSYMVTFSVQVDTVVDEHGNEIGAWIDKRAVWTITPQTLAEVHILRTLVEMSEAAEFHGTEFEDCEFESATGHGSEVNDGYTIDDLYDGDRDETTYYGIYDIEEIE